MRPIHIARAAGHKDPTPGDAGGEFGGKEQRYASTIFSPAPRYLWNREFLVSQRRKQPLRRLRIGADRIPKGRCDCSGNNAVDPDPQRSQIGGILTVTDSIPALASTVLKAPLEKQKIF